MTETGDVYQVTDKDPLKLYARFDAYADQLRERSET